MIQNRARRVSAGLCLLCFAGSAVPLLGDCPVSFQRGDSNRDSRIDLSDPIATLSYLFRGAVTPTCIDAADADDDGKVGLTDAVFTVGYLFLGGTPLPPPLVGACGFDPTEDELDCLEYPPCGAPPEAGCTDNDCCPFGSYCEKDVDACDGVGVCVDRPEICPRIFDPYCGCDGNTYSNRCAAAAAGVNVVHRGECGKGPNCNTNDECDFGSYCEKVEGDCAIAGQCVPKPEGCEKILDPVCGCDGLTYGNPCEAAAQGISVAYHGECRQGELCTSNDQCDPGEYCAKSAALCAEPGVCGSLPDLCADVFEPVCGCDGVTYGNACYAAANGVNIARKVPCDAGPECKSNEECELGSFCSKTEGFCGEIGFCHATPDPAACNDLPEDPVCGCDGVTYINSCQAELAGVSIQKHGDCREGAECSESTDCLEEQFCFKKEGFCIEPGICVQDVTPADCLDAPDEPVCGCDDVTYKSQCDAALVGINVAYRGACDGIPRCNSNKDCEPDSYCVFQEGNCGGLGFCTVRPVECPPDLEDPVCGCDGTTYLNECIAASAGINISFRGKCDGGVLDCKTSAFCGQGAYCAKSEGNCDGSGRCESRPSECNDISDPVCGCDGITYTNECQAHLAGVNVSQSGECPP